MESDDSSENITLPLSDMKRPKIPYEIIEERMSDIDRVAKASEQII